MEMKRNTKVDKRPKPGSQPFEAEAKKLRKQLAASEQARLDQTRKLREQLKKAGVAPIKRSSTTQREARPLSFLERLKVLVTGAVPDGVILAVTEVPHDAPTISAAIVGVHEAQGGTSE
jgi:hypothetical protein